MKLKKLAGLISLLCTSPAWAIEPFTVQDIRVEGIQRTEAGTVFSYLPVKVGDTMDDTQAAAAIRALFATGFFRDVRLEVEQGVLIVLVRERPSIASIELNGIKDFPKEQLKDNMKYAGLAEARIFDKGALEKATQELKRQYVARGKYGVSVTTSVTELERNRVAVAFNVVEGEVSRIKQINLDGSFAYTIALEVAIGVPLEFSLSQNYPNPFNPTTTIEFDLPRAINVDLIVYDNLGRKVKTLVEGVQPAGYHKAVFDAQGLSSGMYYYRIAAGDFVKVKKLILLR